MISPESPTKRKNLKKLLPKKLRKPKLPEVNDVTAAISDKLDKLKGTEEPLPVGRITNETVIEHREQVLGRARKYIYPLQHSKHRIVTITTTIAVAALVIFMVYSTAALYYFKSTSSFIYRVTQVVPFPVAKAGSNYVSYENYLFDVRQYMYFYHNQQQVDFGSKVGQQQLDLYKKQALQQVITDAYVKQLAAQQHLSVSSKEVNDQVTVMRNQNRLGGSQQAFEDALRQNFGWSIYDFKRAVKQQLLQQKVIAKLDTATQARAQAALGELRAGADFAAVATKYSDDASSKASGGAYPADLSVSDRDISPATMAALVKLQPGQTSGLINTGYGLQIVKKISVAADGKIKASHIDFNFKPINTYIDAYKKAGHPSHTYIKL